MISYFKVFLSGFFEVKIEPEKDDLDHLIKESKRFDTKTSVSYITMKTQLETSKVSWFDEKFFPIYFEDLIHIGIKSSIITSVVQNCKHFYIWES